MYLVCIWHAVISLFDYDKELAGDMDYYAFITLISSYGAFQLIYTILVILKVRIDCNQFQINLKKL